MTEPVALDEIVASRNRLVDQRQKATDTLSLTLRTIGMGLAAIAYSFVFAAAPNAALVSQRTPLFAASTLGALSILLDVLQSFADRNSAQRTLDFMKTCREREYTPTAIEIENLKKESGGRIASSLLVFKAILCGFGVGALLLAIANTL